MRVKVFVLVQPYQNRSQTFGIRNAECSLSFDQIDSFLKMVDHPMDTLEGLFENLDKFSNRRGVKIIISASGDPKDVPEFLKPFMV